jgi:hypothetical protein
MKEKFQPISESDKPKQNIPEAGAGPLGLPPPGSEQAPQGGGIKSPERQPLLEHGKGQGEHPDLNVSSANTGDAESPEAELQDKSPITEPPKRRRRSGVAGGRLHGWGYSYGEDQSPRTSESKDP